MLSIFPPRGAQAPLWLVVCISWGLWLAVSARKTSPLPSSADCTPPATCLHTTSPQVQGQFLLCLSGLSGTDTHHVWQTRYRNNSQFRVEVNVQLDFHVYVFVFRVEHRPETEWRKDETDFWTRRPARTGSGTVQRPDHRWECCEERSDGGQGCHRQQNDELRVPAAAGVWWAKFSHSVDPFQRCVGWGSFTHSHGGRHALVLWVHFFKCIVWISTPLSTYGDLES